MKNILKMALVVVTLGFAANGYTYTPAQAAASCKAATRNTSSTANATCNQACKAQGNLSGACKLVNGTAQCVCEKIIKK